MTNAILLIVLLWAGGVVAVALGLLFVKALDILEDNHDI